MPAQIEYVTLDQAKSWAKRLVKSQDLPKLAQAQEAVAHMLGHASWHALRQFYQNTPEPASEALVTPTPASAEGRSPRDIDETAQALLEHVQQAYPDLQARQVFEFTREIVSLETDEHELADCASKLERSGYDVAESVRRACRLHLKKNAVPKGFLLIRVLDAKDRVHVIQIANQVFHDALYGPPAPAVGRSRTTPSRQPR